MEPHVVWNLHEATRPLTRCPLGRLLQHMLTRCIVHSRSFGCQCKRQLKARVCRKFKLACPTSPARAAVWYYMCHGKAAYILRTGTKLSYRYIFDCLAATTATLCDLAVIRPLVFRCPFVTNSFSPTRSRTPVKLMELRPRCSRTAIPHRPHTHSAEYSASPVQQGSHWKTFMVERSRSEMREVPSRPSSCARVCSDERLSSRGRTTFISSDKCPKQRRILGFLSSSCLFLFSASPALPQAQQAELKTF